MLGKLFARLSGVSLTKRELALVSRDFGLSFIVALPEQRRKNLRNETKTPDDIEL